MTTTEHLNAITAKCRELLAIAEKRTPGTWTTGKGNKTVREAANTGAYSFIARTHLAGGFCPREDSEKVTNAAFIAACAGSAEAGWRATIAAIEMACEMRAHLLAEFGDGWRCDFVDDKIKLILAAWPEELL